MLAEIVAALNSLKIVKDTVQGINATLSEVALAQVKLDLMGKLGAVQDALHTAQATNFEITKRIDDLEKALVKAKDWDAQKERYELVALKDGALVHRLKQEFVGKPEPAHEICPSCYQRAEKQYLQGERMGTIHRLSCHACKLVVDQPGVYPAPTPRRGGNWRTM